MPKIVFEDLKDKVINMHTHTVRCQHAVGEEREYVEKAIEAGFEVLGFSDHAPYVFRKDYVSPIRMRLDELEGYVDTVLSLKQEYKNEIEIYCGLEMEYFPKLFERTMKEIDKYPIDYMILGQHFYDEEESWIGTKRPWSDEEHLELYVKRILDGLATERFFYVAHPDIMHYTGDVEIYRTHMRKIALELKKRQMPIEVNVNGFRDGLHYPNPEFIRLGVECGNDFVIGVDAHAPSELMDFETYQACIQLVEKEGGKIKSCLPIDFITLL